MGLIFGIMCFLRHIKKYLLKNIFVHLGVDQTCLTLLFGHSVKHRHAWSSHNV